MRCRSVWLVAIFALLVPSHLMSQDWRVRYGLPYQLEPEPADELDTWSITVKSEPRGKMILCCSSDPHPSFEIVWWERDSRSIPLRLLRLAPIVPRGKPPRLKRAFTRKVQSEDGGFVLRHSVADSKYTGMGKLLSTDIPTRVFEGSSLEDLQRIYHSESVSWRTSERGKPNTFTTGDSARRTIDELLGRCGMSSPPAEPNWAELADRGETLSASGANPLQKNWRVRPGTPFGHDPANSRSIVARGKPKGRIIILCTRTTKDVYVFAPGSVWKGRAMLGFTRRVQTEDGGFILRHSVLDSKDKGTERLRNTPVRYFDGSASDILRRIYHSESVSMGNPKRPKTVITGGSARRAIDEMLDFCGIDPPSEPSASPESPGRSPAPYWWSDRQKDLFVSLPLMLDPSLTLEPSSPRQLPEQAGLDVSSQSTIEKYIVDLEAENDEESPDVSLPSMLDPSLRLEPSWPLDSSSLDSLLVLHLSRLRQALEQKSPGASSPLMPALNCLERLSRSKSFSWSGSKRGKPNTIITVDSVRRAIDKLLDDCGIGLLAEQNWDQPGLDVWTSPHKTVHFESEFSGLPRRYTTGQAWPVVWCESGPKSGLAGQPR